MDMSNNTKSLGSKQALKLEGIKQNIRSFHDYFVENYEYFKLMRKFIFISSLSEKDRGIYTDLGWPTLQFNILEAFISRLLGEFAASEPFVTVRQKANAKVDPQLLHVIEGNFRNIFTESNRDNMEYETFRDCLSGGFSAIKVYTDYLYPGAHHQEILMRRVFNPCLVGFDENAMSSHKGDGRYCYEIFPKTKYEFEQEFGKKYTQKMSFKKGKGQLYGYDWSYGGSGEGDEIVLVADYYEKTYSTLKTVFLSDGQVMETEKYEKFARDFFKKTMLQPPKVVGKERESTITKIQRRLISENDILIEEMTDYDELPYVFVDGASILDQEKDGRVRQVVRSYVHHLISTQKLKDLAGILTANELENTMQSKLMISQQALPNDDAAREALTNYQKAKLIIFNGKDEETQQPLMPPTAIPRVPAPPEMLATFNNMDASAQAILGTRDAEIGANQRFVSGEAIAEAAMQGNMAARPFRTNYLRALNQIAKIMKSLMPKVHTLPGTMPVKDKSGKVEQVPINMEGAVQIKDMQSQLMDVVIEAGVDFENQRMRASMILDKLSARIPMLGEILGSTPEGLSMVLDNVDMRGIDALKGIVGNFVQQVQQQKQQAMQMQQQQMQAQQQSAMLPLMIKQEELKLAQAKLQNDAQLAQLKLQLEYQLEVAKLGIDQQNADTKQYDVLSKAEGEVEKKIMEAHKIDAQNARTMVDALQAEADIKHSHAMDILTLDHTKATSQLAHELEKVKVALQHARETDKMNISRDAMKNINTQNPENENNIKNA